jgi:putative DNA primase/helicase
MSTKPGSKATGIGFTDLSTVKEEQVRWLWQGRIPFGKISILEGDPDLGKSMVTCDLVARVTTGRPFPGAQQGPRNRASRLGRGVILVLAEDDLADTVVPRLRAAGANLAKVKVITLPRDDEGNLVPITIPEDLNELRKGITEQRAKLIVFDPITAFLSKDINSHNDASVRQAMTPLAEVAQATGSAILLIRHLNKSGDMKALYRGGGSIAFSGAARSVLTVNRHPDDPANLRVLSHVKGNLTSNHRQSIVYEVEADLEGIPTVVWGDEIDLTADDIMKKADARKEAPARDDATDFLLDLLGDRKEVLAKEAISLARDAGINERTLRRAAKVMGIVSTKVHNEKGHIIDWVWLLTGGKRIIKLSDD